MKKVWLTLLHKDEEAAQKLSQMIQGYGLGVDGHFWSPNLEKMEYLGPREPMLEKDVALWVIVGGPEDFSDSDIMFGLSMLSHAVQAERGHGFPLFILHAGDPPSADDLPTSLRHGQLFPIESSAVGAKMVAKANVPFKPAESEYRLDVHGMPGIGLWLEIGPASGTWDGVLAGVSGGDIDAHGVGPKGQLPGGKMVLNYPQQGLKLNLGDREYTAWAVRNEIGAESSYFFRITDMPDSLLFTQYSEDDDAEAFVVKLS